MTDPVGRPQGGFKSEAGKAAYWRLQYESAIGALADLIAEHTETVETLADLRAKVEALPNAGPATHPNGRGYRMAVRDVLDLIDGGGDE